MTPSPPARTPRRPRLLLTAIVALSVTVPLAQEVGAAPASVSTSPTTGWTTTSSATPPRAQRSPSADRAKGRKPNIVMVMADDMRADDLRFAPNVRRLIAREGLTFANSFSPYPLCCPARASLLSGQYAHNHRVLYHGTNYGFGAFDDSRTLATSLRRAGYRTGFVGKYLNGYGPRPSKVTGRPTSYRYVPAGWDDWAGALDGPGAWSRSGERLFTGGTYHYFNTPFNVNGRIDASYRGRYQTRVISELSRRMVNRFSHTSDPFFLYASFVAPHGGGPTEADDPIDIEPSDGIDEGFTTPARPAWVRGRFDRAVRQASGMPSDGGPAEADVSDKPTFFRGLPELRPSEKDALTLVTRQRAESIYVMDRRIGRLVRQLKRLGEWRRTVFMFTSDNGYFLGEHRQRTGKIRAHEPALRVPFLVTGPGMRGGETRYDPITTVDVTASILDLAGARAPRRPDGTSLVPTMRRGDRGWDAPVVTEALKDLRPAIPELPTNPDGDPETDSVVTRRPPGSIPLLPRSAYPSSGERADAEALFGPDEKRTSVGLRTPRWSFNLYRNGEGELYDMAQDPTQEVNRYSDADYAPVVDLLRSEWARYRDCAGAACRAPMEPELTATPAELADLAARYWSAIRSVYGAGMVLPFPAPPTEPPTGPTGEPDPPTP